MELDGVTPHAYIDVALLNNETKAKVVAARTNKKGGFTLEDVAAGTYIVHVGNPGMNGSLNVTPDAPAGTLNIKLPRVANVAVPKGGSQWAQAEGTILGMSTTTAAVVGGTGAVVVVGGTALIVNNNTGNNTKQSPNSP
jgi:hypothetical protein